MRVKIKRLPELKDLPLPVRAHKGDSGMDVFAAIDAPVVLEPFVPTKISAGISIELPEGIEIQMRPKSSQSAAGILVHFGTCDQPFRGTYQVILHNLTTKLQTIRPGQKIGQMVMMRPVYDVEWEEVESLNETDRGEGGFGSTGGSVEITKTGQ